MELREAEHLARHLMGVHVQHPGWKFRWVNAVTYIGQAVQSRDHTVQFLELSRPYTLKSDEAVIRDTILHEISHINVGINHGHDRVWMRECLRLGASPRRAASPTSTPDLRKELAPWQGTCPAGHTSPYRYWRKPRKDRSCSRCNPRVFDPAHVLTYVDTRLVRV